MFKTTVVTKLPYNRTWTDSFEFRLPDTKWTVNGYKLIDLDNNLFIKPIVSEKFIDQVDFELLSRKIAVVLNWKRSEPEKLIQFLCSYNDNWNEPLELTLRKFVAHKKENERNEAIKEWKKEIGFNISGTNTVGEVVSSK